tara:strand:- start:781 stop:1140 length:360 start_codon:yes stop_codon:yes gene_type:complete
MWIVSNDDITVASTWGATIHLVAGEPRQVGKDLGLLCLQAGCTEVQESEVPAMEPAPVEPVEEVVIEDMPGVETAETVVSPDFESMTKIQLEEYGRTIGIELDRRKKKSALIEDLKAAQ